MTQFVQGQRVWISILPANPTGQPRPAGSVEPIDVVPGIVTDATVMNRHVPGRDQTIYNSVLVLSYHELPSGKTFYREQGQGQIGLSDREGFYAPVIDGPEDHRLNIDWLNELRKKVAESTNNIAAPARPAIIEAAMAKYGAPKPNGKAAQA